MNIIYGSANILGNDSQFDLICEKLKKIYNCIPIKIKNNSESIQCGYISNGGVVLGHVRLNDVSLMYLGVIHKPLPQWDYGSPIDNPNYTAEYLLSRYQKLGLNFLDEIFGQYSVVICEHSKSKLILASDSIGLRSIFYYMESGNIIFSSNLLSLAISLDYKLEVDRSLEDFFLIYGFFPWNRTPFKGVLYLPPKSILEWSKGQCTLHSICQSELWEGRFSQSDSASLTEDEAVNNLYQAFMLAVEEQTASAKKAAVLLGGFDSALVASALHRLGKKVETFSFYYDSPEFNQPYVDTLASYLKIDHNWFPITESLIHDGLQAYSTKFNQPTNWPNYVIQTERLCSFMRDKGFLYCYSGDGCDSVFLGYPGTHKRALVFNALISLPPQIVKTLLRLVQWPNLEKRLGHPYRVALNIIRSLGRQKSVREYLTFRIFDELSLKQLRINTPPNQEKEIEEILLIFSSSLKGISPIRIAYLGKSAVSPNKTKIVGSSDSTGVVINSPYLHLGLKNLALNLPEQLCRPQQRNPSSVTGKYILMRMAEKKKLLPKEVIYQKKVAAVDAPIDNWYAGPLKPLLIELVKGLPFSYNERYISAAL